MEAEKGSGLMRSKRTKACDITPKVRREVLLRDEMGCVLCNMGYTPTGDFRYEIAHFIARSQGGLGVPENLVLLCKTHHEKMDNGPCRDISEALVKKYLKSLYPEWEYKDLRYEKGYRELNNGRMDKDIPPDNGVRHMGHG